MDLFEYADLDGNETLDREEFTTFMLASILVHAYHK